MPAVPVHQRRDRGVALADLPAEQERRPHVDFELLGEVVLAPLPQPGDGRCRPPRQAREVLVHRRPCVMGQRVVRLAVAPGETLVAAGVLGQLVALSRPGQAEQDEFGLARWRHGQDVLDPVADLGAPAADDLDHHGTDERVCQMPVADGAGPLERGAVAGPQLVQAGGALDLVRAGQEPLDAGGLPEAPAGVTPGHLASVAGLGQFPGRELAHGLQQPEPPGERIRLDHQHRPFGQVTEQIPDLSGGDLRVGGDGLGRGEVERADEDGESLEKPPGRRAEQVVGPLDGGAQRPVPLGACPPALRQQPEVVIEASGDVCRGEAGGPGRGQLDGQRDTVQMTADLHHGLAPGPGVEGG